MKKFLHNVAARFKSMRERRSETQYEVEWNENNVNVKWLTLENETGSLSFSWDSVISVDTFKRDHFSVDCICLTFQTDDGWIEVNKDMKGWNNFLDAVQAKLLGFPLREMWYTKVMLPAFNTNHSRLWERRTTEQPAASDARKTCA
jgi:hypothetical protein